jgi:hypothetical protein
MCEDAGRRTTFAVVCSIEAGIADILAIAKNIQTKVDVELASEDEMPEMIDLTAKQDGAKEFAGPVGVHERLDAIEEAIHKIKCQQTDFDNKQIARIRNIFKQDIVDACNADEGIPI